MKKLLNGSKDWKEYKNKRYSEGDFLQGEEENIPTKYPCIIVETKWIKGCSSADDQFVMFIYSNDFKKQKIMKKFKETQIIKKPP